MQGEHDAQTNLNDAVNQHGLFSDQAAAAALRLEQATNGVAKAAIDNDVAQRQLAEDLSSQSLPVLQQELQHYQALQTAYPEAAAALQPYIDQVQHAIDKLVDPALNGTHTATLELGTDDFYTSLRAAQTALASLDQGLASIVVPELPQAAYDYLNRQGRMAGGPVDPYGTYVVGEAGPEVLQMGGMGGYVVPNAQVGAWTQQASSSATNVQIVVNVSADPSMTHAQADAIGSTVGVAALREVRAVIGAL